jgi:hypothetical protein
MFMAAHRLWGALGTTIVDDAAQRYASGVLDCEWKCGFIRSARGRASAEHLELVLREFAGLDIAGFVNSLYLESSGWSLTFGDALAAHPWPALRELEIYTSDPDPMERLDARAVVPMLAPERTPALSKLTLNGTRSTDGLCLALATTPIGRQLEALTLLDGQFTDEGVAYLQGARFDKLRRLRISGTGPRTAANGLARLAASTEIRLRDGNDESYDR